LAGTDWRAVNNAVRTVFRHLNEGDAKEIIVRFRESRAPDLEIFAEMIGGGISLRAACVRDFR